MAWVAVAVVGGSVVSGMMASDEQSEAASTAAGAQTQASEAGIAEQRRQFDAVRALLDPYTAQGSRAISGLMPYEQAGSASLEAQRNLIGQGGFAAQQAAIGDLSGGAEMQAYLQQGENALLQNASATGGLRGGNTQSALAQFRPQLLAQLIDKQYGRLGGLTALGQTTSSNIAQLGQASAAGQAAAAQQTGASIASLLGQQGAAAAGSALASGQAQAQMWGNIGSSIGNVATLKALKVF